MTTLKTYAYVRDDAGDTATYENGDLARVHKHPEEPDFGDYAGGVGPRVVFVRVPWEMDAWPTTLLELMAIKQ